MLVNAYVKHDRLDDEVMVIDLDSGAYFALTGAAADAWDLLAAGHPQIETATLLAHRYDVPLERAVEDLRVFVEDVVRERLLADAPPRAMEDPPLPAPCSPYASPRIERFDELADLLLLDPVHEVEPTGWPLGKAQN